MKHPLIALVSLLSAAYMLIRYPDLVLGVVVAAAVFVLIGHWFVRALASSGRSRGPRG